MLAAIIFDICNHAGATQPSPQLQTPPCHVRQFLGVVLHRLHHRHLRYVPESSRSCCRGLIFCTSVPPSKAFFSSSPGCFYSVNLKLHLFLHHLVYELIGPKDSNTRWYNSRYDSRYAYTHRDYDSRVNPQSNHDSQPICIQWCNCESNRFYVCRRTPPSEHS